MTLTVSPIASIECTVTESDVTENEILSLYSSLRAFSLVLLIVLAGGKAVHAKDIDQRFLDIYLRGAFAQTERLVKFVRAPRISIYCGSEACGLVAQELSGILKAGVIDSESEGSGAEIEVLLLSDADEQKKPREYFARADEKVDTLTHPDCSLVQSRRGFEVVKVIVAVTVSSGINENVICVLNEVLRGSGFTIQGRYPEYLEPYLNLDASKLAIALHGFSLLIEAHFLEVTSPGQDKATVEKALKGTFKIGH